MQEQTAFALRRARSKARTSAVLILFVSSAIPAWPQNKAADLTTASLEDLMNIEVVSVSKTQQKLSHTASAVFVITQEDIRRSGPTII